MKSRKTYLIIIFLFCFVTSIKAEVFSLFPFSKGRAGTDAAKALGGVKLWSEPVVVNGMKTGMQLILLNRGLDEIIIFFRKQYPNALFRANKDSLLIEIKHKKNSLERIYLVKGKGAYPVIQFSIILQNGLPKDIEWPRELPIPPSSSPELIIFLPERNVIYGTFTTLIPKKSAMSLVSSTLIADGWLDWKQGVFIKKNPFSICMVSFSEDEDSGKTRGFILKRKLSE